MALIIVGVLVVLSIVGLLYADSSKPRDRDRGGFEDQPGSWGHGGGTGGPSE